MINTTIRRPLLNPEWINVNKKVISPFDLCPPLYPHRPFVWRTSLPTSRAVSCCGTGREPFSARQTSSSRWTPWTACPREWASGTTKLNLPPTLWLLWQAEWMGGHGGRNGGAERRLGEEEGKPVRAGDCRCWVFPLLPLFLLLFRSQTRSNCSNLCFWFTFNFFGLKENRNNKQVWDDSQKCLFLPLHEPKVGISLSFQHVHLILKSSAPLYSFFYLL